MTAAPTPTDDELTDVFERHFLAIYVEEERADLARGLRALFNAGRIQALEEAAQIVEALEATLVSGVHTRFAKASAFDIRAAAIRTGETHD